MDDRTLLASIRDVVGIEHTEDDCAVLPCGDVCMVATADMVHETTDFPAGMTDWQRGWMAAAVTISDIASMGASPCYLLAAVGLDRSERLRPIMQGVRDCCERFGAAIVGGDIDFHAELTIVTAGLGIVEPRHLVRRRGSRVGDLICISGVPGRAEAALLGYTRHERALFEPQPRVAEGRAIARAGATSMMDISDGLALSLYDLMEVNGCGYRIDLERLPLPEGVPRDLATELALYGGGDYHLLFTIPPERMPVAGIEQYCIGTVAAEPGVSAGGRTLEKRGYQHRWTDSA
ncbi:MAG: thiamine-phosphate kinase [Methanomicrobiales archaeon]|nr:thiamine-phosphate kinase [Methanomicrobiales archaeon]